MVMWPSILSSGRSGDEMACTCGDGQRRGGGIGWTSCRHGMRASSPRKMRQSSTKGDLYSKARCLRIRRWKVLNVMRSRLNLSPSGSEDADGAFRLAQQVGRRRLAVRHARDRLGGVVKVAGLVPLPTAQALILAALAAGTVHGQRIHGLRRGRQISHHDCRYVGYRQSPPDSPTAILAGRPRPGGQFRGEQGGRPSGSED